MVLLDVVYNHFGPEGNYLNQYAPDFFMEAQTPWGGAIDFQRPEVQGPLRLRMRFHGLATIGLTGSGSMPYMRS